MSEPQHGWQTPPNNHVREAARAAVWGIVRPVLIVAAVAFAVSAFTKMQTQLSDMAKAQAVLTEMKRTELANLAELAAENRKSLQKIREETYWNLRLSRVVAEKVGVTLPPEKKEEGK